MQQFLTMLALALVTASFLWPVEEAVTGAGLYLVVLWMVVGALHRIHRFRIRQGDSTRVRESEFSWADLGVLLIVVGHVVSTIVVFREQGDRRAALNLTFEWLGLWVAWRFFRAAGHDRLSATRIFQVMIVMAAGLAAYGIWQHHVFYPQQAQWYREQRALLDMAVSQPDGGGLMQAAEVMSRLQSENIPLEGSQRILWENRLLSSSEPFGTFSLANTLAGVLATSLVLLAGQMSLRWLSENSGTLLEKVVLLFQAGAVTYCLILTKSRSAWGGAAAGLILLVVFRSRIASGLKIVKWGMGATVAVGLIGALAAWQGALDKEVVIEATRSLNFRLLYWAGTAKMLSENALAGSGPGNFRQLYLRYKSGESSEEIRDPHNFLLEAWSAGGLLGFAGLLLLIGVVMVRMFRTSSRVSGDFSRLKIPKRTWRIVPLGVLAGFALSLAWDWINGQPISPESGSRLLLLTGLAVLLVGSRQAIVAPDSLTFFAASVAMMVNLLAAGGFEMPAVMLMMLACVALGLSRAGSSVSQVRENARGKFLRGIPCVLFCLAGGFAVFRWGLWPVSVAERHVLQADMLLRQQRNQRAALSEFQKAAQSDLLSVIPRQRIAELAAYRLEDLNNRQSLQPDSAAAVRIQQTEIAEAKQEFQKLLGEAIDATDALIRSDRRGIAGVRLKARCLSIGARRLNDGQMLAQAVKEQLRVVEMYPSSVDEWVELVRLYDFDPQKRWTQRASSAAEKALTLEEVNQRWGHRDRYLDEEELSFLKRVSGAGQGI